MKKVSLSLLFMLSLASFSRAQSADMVLNVDLKSRGATVPASLYGLFFEEINHAGDGGLYGELLENRSFEERVLPSRGYTIENGELVPPTVCNHLAGHPTIGRFKWGTEPHPGWVLENQAAAKATVQVASATPNFATAPNYLSVNISERSEGVSLVNDGYWGIHLKKNDSYNLRMYVRTQPSYAGGLTLRLVGANGKVIATQKVATINDGQWNEYKEVLTAADTTSVGKLFIDFEGKGTIDFDYVSLFPAKTFKGRPNGMRVDVAQLLSDLRPAFLRWPGGCVVEGITLDNRIEWKKTIGDPATRPGEYSTWGYNSTYGFGYKEFLDFCEDTGAKGMFVCNVGIACQARTGEADTDEAAEAYLQDALDAIEYALGDVNSTWGAVRAKEGHPAPYALQYVEIGNENSGPLYDRRFNRFYSVIKAKYPQLTLISNHGLGDPMKSITKADMIDPHWYVAPEYFFKNADIFDKAERGKHTIYVGEYACNQGVGGGNMLAALSEAAFITGMERNSDLVTMASYAPLLENVNDRGWPTNLIWMKNDQVMGRSSYYVQKLFVENKPTYNLNTTATVKPGELEELIQSPGYVGLGTWNTQSEFKDLKITHADGKTVVADMNDPSQWIVKNGDWTNESGVYRQTSDKTMTALLWNKAKIEAGSVIELKARKLSGSEGFLIYFGLEKSDLHRGHMLNVGGWGNSSTAFQTVSDGSGATASEMIGDKVASNRWYDIKIVVNKRSMDYYADGKLVTKRMSEPLKRKFHIAGFDENANEVVIKVVNADDKPSNAQINLTGGQVEKKGTIITLSASSKEDENSFAEPLKISPVKTSYTKFSNSFTYRLKPNSVTVLRIKKK